MKQRCTLMATRCACSVRFRALAVCAFLMLAAACTAGQPPPESDTRPAEDPSDVVVSAVVDPTRAALDEPIRFTLRAVYPADVQLQLPDIGPDIAGLRIVDFGETGPDPVDARFVFTQWYDLRADVAGTYIIPALTVSAGESDGAREIMTPQIFIQVGAHPDRSDNETMQDIIDIKPLAALPRDLRPVIIGSACAAGLFVAGLAVWLYVRRRRTAVCAPPTPAHVLALEQLDQLERDGLAERGSAHAFYVRLSDIFRQYLQNRFAVPAVEQTTQELVRSLEALPDMAPAVRHSTRRFLLRADLVKFARYQPASGDAQQSLQQVRDVIVQTRQDMQAESSTETTGNDAL